MKASTASSHDTIMQEATSPPVPSSSETMALDSQINGAAVTSNSSISAFAEQPYQNGSSSQDQIFSSSAVKELPSSFGQPPDDVLSNPTKNESAVVTNSELDSVQILNDYSKLSSAIESNITLASGDTQDLLPSSLPEVSANLEAPIIENQVPSAFPDQTVNSPSEGATAGGLFGELVDRTTAIPSSEVQDEAQQPVPEPSTTEPATNPLPQSMDLQPQRSIDAPVKVAREREDDEGEGPAAKRAKVDEPSVNDTTDAEHQSLQAPAVEVSTPMAQDNQVITPAVVTPLDMPTISHYAAMPAARARPWGSMTDAQSKAILEGMRNLRKNKSVAAFKEPVNYMALNIPSYPTLVKYPMDLSTMEKKLKDGKYTSVSDYIADFELMVQNAITFNGHEHGVAQSGMVLKAQFESQLKRVPEAGQTVPAGIAPKKQKAPKSSTPNRDSKPKAPRPVHAPAPAVSAPQNYAVGPDGIPTIRRDSTAADGRPKREIHRPPPRDLPYSSAKPRKKKFQTELRFCDHILIEMKKAKYLANYGIGSPFQAPVDPVALNIPDYFKIIKKPMDMQTITEKLNAGQYGNAKDFEADMRLIFSNCYKFNPPGNVIHNYGKEYEDVFNSLWREKSAWISDNSPASDPPSPGSDDEEEEDDEDEEDDDSPAATIARIQQQMSALSEQAQALLSSTQRKSVSKGSKKAKATKPSAAKSGRKSGSMGGIPSRSEKKPKPKAKVKPVTNAQKQEISNKIGELPMEQVSRAADMIRASMRKIGRHDLASKPDDDLEFDIDLIPDDTLHALLNLVRSYLPANAKEEDDDYRVAPPKRSSTAAPKSKKNKPMSKYEQEDTISRIKGQLEAFQNPGSASKSPENNHAVESSDDEEDSGSESEEE